MSFYDGPQPFSIAKARVTAEDGQTFELCLCDGFANARLIWCICQSDGKPGHPITTQSFELQGVTDAKSELRVLVGDSARVEFYDDKGELHP